MSNKTTDFLVFPIILDPFSGYKYTKTSSYDHQEHLEVNDGDKEPKEEQVIIQQHHLGQFCI